MKWSLLALVIGFCIDLVVGDPHSIPHPVIGIGKQISFFEKILRHLFPKNVTGETVATGSNDLYRCSCVGVVAMSLDQPLASSGGGKHHVLADPCYQIPTG